MMKPTKHTLPLLLPLLLTTLSTSAQVQGEGEYRLSDATQLWRTSDNAAGLAIDSSAARGTAYFGLHHHDATLRRVQEGGTRNGLSFVTERYQPIGKYLHGYGRFGFDMHRTHNRAFADQMRPYDSNPYITGSSVPGKYDLQQFDFQAKIGTVDLKGWRAGLTWDYTVGDLSRLRDPRSRSQMLDYKVTPAITYTQGTHTWGLSGYYERRKEKALPLTTVQSDPNLKYYQMSGMEHAQGVVGGYSGFSREYVDHRFGTELAYGYKTEAYQQLTRASISRGQEYIYESVKRQPGRYYTYNYALSTEHRIRHHQVLHEVGAAISYTDAYADEYRQQLITTRDSATGFSSQRYDMQFVYKKRYQHDLLSATLRYRASIITANAIHYYSGISATHQRAQHTYLLPTSRQRHGAWDIKYEAGAALWHNRLWVDASATWHHPTSTQLQLADATTDYAQQVLMPDMAYYRSRYVDYALSLTYRHTMQIRGHRAHPFVRLYANYLDAQHGKRQRTLGMSIGLNY